MERAFRHELPMLYQLLKRVRFRMANLFIHAGVLDDLSHGLSSSICIQPEVERSLEQIDVPHIADEVPGIAVLRTLFDEKIYIRYYFIHWHIPCIRS